MKKIEEMSVEEMRKELLKFCSGRQCERCPLSLSSMYSNQCFCHGVIRTESDPYKLALMLEIARGGLVWADPEDAAQCTKEYVAGDLEIDDDSTGIVIIGKKPAMMTIYFDQPAEEGD